MDPVSISALAGAVVLIIGAIAGATVKIIQALHEARDERVAAKTAFQTTAEVAVQAATEAKDVAASGTEDIRKDLRGLTTSIDRLNGRFSALERKVNGLGQDQSALLTIVANLDEKMEQHIKDSTRVIA